MLVFQGNFFSLFFQSYPCTYLTSYPSEAPGLSVILTFLALVSVLAEAIIQVLLVAVDGGVRPSQAISCSIREPSWFGEFRLVNFYRY